MFIDFLHRFVTDHINCCYFRLMTYSIGENQSCEAKGSIRQSQPLVGQDVERSAIFETVFCGHIFWRSFF